MKCIYCGSEESKVLDSRAGEDVIRRRRECLSCGRRFTTYEKAEIIPFLIIRRDGSKQSYQREKLLASIQRSCLKRNISENQIKEIVDNIEKNVQNRFLEQISWQELAQLVLKELKKIDFIAFVRYATFVQDFDIETLKEFVSKL